MEYLPDSEEKREEPHMIESDKGEEIDTIKPDKEEYVTRLETRIRELAIRLHQLETEKLKNKRNLVETQSKQGSTSKSEKQNKSPSRELISELNALRTKVDRLNNENRRLKAAITKNNEATREAEATGETEKELKEKIGELEREKTAIEESLRGEVLDNEEKRNYIEILKEPLEAKMEDLGLKELLLQTVEEGASVNDLFTKLIIMKKEVEDKYSEMNKFKADMIDMERTILNLKKQMENQNIELNSTHSKNTQLVKDNEESTKRIQDLIQKVHYLIMIVGQVAD